MKAVWKHTLNQIQAADILIASTVVSVIGGITEMMG